MKKTFLCVTALLLVLSVLCGCSLFSEAKETVTAPTVVTDDPAPSEPAALEKWGEPFSAEGTKEQIAYQFVSNVFSSTWRSLFTCDMALDVTKWGIRSESTDDCVGVYLTFAVRADNPSEQDTAILTEGNYQAGKDNYEGCLILTRYCSLQKQTDGTWQCVGFGLSW